MSISLNAIGVAYTQNFDTLAASGTSSVLPDGWAFSESGTNANTSYNTGTGSGNAGDTYSFGATGSTERALGGLQSGSLVPTIGASFSNLSGSTIGSLSISYFGEMWRAGVTNRGAADRLDFQYSLDATSLTTGTWTDVNALDFNSPVVSVTLGALNGNAAANRTNVAGSIDSLSLAPGATIWIRWTDFNITSSDDGLAVDDFSVTPAAAVVAKPQVTLSSLDANAAEEGQDPGAVRFTRSGDTTSALQVGYSLGGTASGDDYTPLLTGSITIPAGQSSVDLVITPKDDGFVEGDESLQFTLQASADYDLGASTTASITIVDNDAPPTPIHDIQAAAHLSPKNGQGVRNVQGIVTALAGNGFYLQDPNPDADPATSEGIFVFTNSAPSVAVGDAVRVNGTVQEFRAGGAATNLTLTEIVHNAGVQALSIKVDSSGNPLPAAVVLGSDRIPPATAINDDFVSGGNVETGGDFDPVHEGIDFWESLEGMRVTVPQPVVVGPTNGFGEIWVLAAHGADASSRTERGGSLATASDRNPERVQLDNLVGSVSMPVLDVGAELGDVTGVMSYSFGNYELLLGSAPTVTQPTGVPREITTLNGGTDLLRVATFNVENLDPGDGATKFGNLAAAIVGNLRAPEIISLEEVQDNNGATNNGVVDASVTLQTLVDAIVAAGGPHYQWRQIDPVNNQDGGEPGGNIRVAFLFDPAKVSFVEGSLARLSDPNLADGDAFASSRKPLVGSFSFNGETVTVIGNHFNSKGGDDPLYGPTQPPVLSSEAQRMQQAGVVKAYVQGLLSSNPAAKIVVAGDLNDFEYSNPLNLLKSAGLSDLVETLPQDQRYTYDFEGNAQVLDHVMASSSLLSLLRGYDVVHINSEFATQVSDHDPSVARFFIERAGLVYGGTRLRDTIVGSAGADTITGGASADRITTGGGNDRIVYTSVLDALDTVTDFVLGTDRLVIDALLSSVRYTGHNPVGDGYLSVQLGVGKTTVLFDADGAAGSGLPRPLVDLLGVQLAASAEVLLDPSLYAS